jgi:hypothetical protein
MEVKMKKLLLVSMVLVMLLIGTSVLAADFSKQLKFEWDQASTDLPNLKEWGLYVMTTSGGTKPAPIVVAYTSGTGPFQASQSFTVTGLPGATVRRYFVLDAVGKNLNRSGFSNEVFYDFVIPFSDVTTPMTLKVTVIVTP